MKSTPDVYGFATDSMTVFYYLMIRCTQSLPQLKPAENLKNTQRKKETSNKTPALTKSMNMDV